jgi:hypothetical protein
MKSKPKLKASIVYTGTITSHKNSLKLNFSKNQPHQLLFQKKYIKPKSGANIINIHNRIHLIIRASPKAIISNAYTSINNKSNITFTTTSQIVFNLGISAFINLSKFSIQTIQ